MSNGLINRQYVGARYVPKIMGEWNKALQYEALSVVTYMGNSFTSKVPVPANVEINNTDYWVNTGNYNAQIENYRNETNTKITYYNTINDLKNSNNAIGSIVKTAGYNVANDGGGAMFIIKAGETNKYCIKLNNNNYAEMIANDTINPSMFGAYGDGINDDTEAVKKCIHYSAIYRAIINANKKYLISDNIDIDIYTCVIMVILAVSEI